MSTMHVPISLYQTMNTCNYNGKMTLVRLKLPMWPKIFAPIQSTQFWCWQCYDETLYHCCSRHFQTPANASIYETEGHSHVNSLTHKEQDGLKTVQRILVHLILQHRDASAHLQPASHSWKLPLAFPQQQRAIACSHYFHWPLCTTLILLSSSQDTGVAANCYGMLRLHWLRLCLKFLCHLKLLQTSHQWVPCAHQRTPKDLETVLHLQLVMCYAKHSILGNTKAFKQTASWAMHKKNHLSNQGAFLDKKKKWRVWWGSASVVDRPGARG